jgi:hypothetical protein
VSAKRKLQNSLIEKIHNNLLRWQSRLIGPINGSPEDDEGSDEGPPPEDEGPPPEDEGPPPEDEEGGGGGGEEGGDEN